MSNISKIFSGNREGEEARPPSHSRNNRNKEIKVRSLYHWEISLAEFPLFLLTAQMPPDVSLGGVGSVLTRGGWRIINWPLLSPAITLQRDGSLS